MGAFEYLEFLELAEQGKTKLRWQSESWLYVILSNVIGTTYTHYSTPYYSLTVGTDRSER